MAELVAERLAAFVEDYRRRPWAPGIDVDCCLALAEWAMWLGHEDPAPHLRGAYADDEGFRAIIANAGGVVPIVERCAAKIGGKRIDAPRPGAIGVIGSPANMQRQWGAIFDGKHWLVRFRDDLGPMTAATLAIWEI